MLALLAAPAAACDGGPTLLDAPLAEPPDDADDLGLFADVARLEVVDPRAIEYRPAHELWSNGADKRRWVVLPAGEHADATDPEAWEWPVGTLFFKAFSFRADATSAPSPVELRMIRRDSDGYTYAVYRFDADGHATRLPGLTPVPVDVTTADGTLTHEIPSQRQCRQCHEAGRRRTLGLNDLSLADTPVGGDRPEIDRLVELGVADLGGRAPVRIEHPDPDTQAVLAYVWANCAHCHDGSVGPNSSFDLRPAVMLENTIDQPTASEAATEGIRIIPGDPDGSIVYRALADEEGARAMPPVGVQLRDAAAIALFRRFIENLPPP